MADTMLNLTSEVGRHISRRERHQAGTKSSRSRESRPTATSSPTRMGKAVEETVVNKEIPALIKDTADTTHINEMENYVSQQISGLNVQPNNFLESKESQLSPRDVASKLLKENSMFGSDSGIASDCSRSLCTSDDEDHDVVDQIGDITLVTSTDGTEGQMPSCLTNHANNEFITESSPCSCQENILSEVKTSISTQNNQETATTQDTTGTPNRTRLHRSAVSLESRSMEHFVEESENEIIEEEEGKGDESEDNLSDRDDASSEGCWVDDSDNNGEDDSADETWSTKDKNSDDDQENDCEKYCRQYQSERFQVFGTSELDVFEVSQIKESGSLEGVWEDDYEFFTDDTSFSGRPTAAGTYGFPQCFPTDIDDVIDFWETDFQVGCHIVSRMGCWEKLGISPQAGEEPADYRKYLLYKTLYFRWVQCNKNKDHWYQKYWNKTLSQAAQVVRGRQKFYPADCVDLATAPELQRLRLPLQTGPCSPPDCSRSISNESTETGLPLGFLDADVTTM